jgi:glycerol-1-phosphatase
MSLLLLVDLDGVVYRGPDPVPGIAAVLAARAAAGDDVVYVTNNSMHYRADYVSRLTALGAPVSPDRVVSAPRATALYVREHEPDVRRVLAVGASGLDRELRDVGLEVVNAGFAAERMAKEGLDGVEAAGAPQAVVAGVDPQLTYLRVAAAADCLRAGAVFIATNRDPVYPTQRFLRPGSGSIIAAIEVASGVTPVVIGKPQPLLLEQAAHAAGRDPKEAIVIGDGVLTDLAAARAVGARTILMLTGVTSPAAAAALPEEERPLATAADAGELRRLLDAVASGSST